MAMMSYYGTDGWQGWLLLAMWMWPWLIASAVWALVALTRGRPRGPQESSAKDPVEILKQRFANGQISEDEFQRAVVTLQNGPIRATGG